MENEKDIEASNERAKELGQTVMPFGKCKGKTFEQIYNEGDYLEWMVKQPDFHNVDIQNLAKEYLEIKSKENDGLGKCNLSDLAREIIKRRDELKDRRAIFNDPLKYKW